MTWHNYDQQRPIGIKLSAARLKNANRNSIQISTVSLVCVIAICDCAGTKVRVVGCTMTLPDSTQEGNHFKEQ